MSLDTVNVVIDSPQGKVIQLEGETVVAVVTEQENLTVVMPGAQGLAGVGADKTYIHDQMTPAAVWNVVHALNKYPSVAIVTSAGEVVQGGIDYLDANTVELTFTSAFAGKAFFN